MKTLLELLVSAFAGGRVMSAICHDARFSDRSAAWYDIPARLIFESYAKVWSILTLNRTWTDDVEKFSVSYTTFAYIVSGLVAFSVFWIIGRRFEFSTRLWMPLVVLYALAHTPLGGYWMGEPFVAGTVFGFVAVGLMFLGISNFKQPMISEPPHHQLLVPTL